MATSRINKPDTSADHELRNCIDTKQSFVMIAGAGSGKTTSLIKGLDYIRSRYGNQLRAKRQKIACVTYTTNAVDEIIGDVQGDSLFHVSTIHSFLWEIISPFQKDIKDWVKQRVREKIAKIQQAIQEYGPRVQQKTKDKDQAEFLRLEEVSRLIDSVNNFRYETGADYTKGIIGHADILRMVPELIQGKTLLKKIVIQKFPFLLIDESQDTAPNVVECFLSVDAQKQSDFCLGFFGDPMQKIYLTGIGKIPDRDNWKTIVKPENFRCASAVLELINLIRKPADQIEQTGGKMENVGGMLTPVVGSARLFILPANEERSTNVEKVRNFIAREEQDPAWRDDSGSDLKILVLEHRMAAKRLGFEQLHAAFKDGTPESIGSGFSEGNSWALSLFQKYILPLIEAQSIGKQSNVMTLLRAFSPILEKEYLQKHKISAEDLKVLDQTIKELVALFADPNISVAQILDLIETRRLAVLDERIAAKLRDEPLLIENAEAISRVLEKYFQCSVNQLLGYDKYIREESVYSTQHDVKGSEFKRVIVILDDEEGKRSTLYSYEKLLGLKPLSDTDTENISEGTESVLDRTRRLFYVCCSRAQKDLAVIWFVQDVDEALAVLKDSIFSDDQIIMEHKLG
ncbi:UvrD-helicase domain-containing protein [Chitinophaga pinensis]|uniref:DNA 3'-5' helicase II n=1 Tax=Chitinophaga pinensis (strain ATCC 43595 / DSM 2588 / LMG 13176 / NBRC 15968 / NCIMB 11800 / UQM 2034) TaxID=485918 RepID=A0A979G6M4_CHIPD|nr:UvrD-helicase domain-containing protein [Chitinophaga pinensis]ACU61676.1 conserved hypothetical protein [Chitinophaga pinensis DSM 2588]